ncbi:MAG: C4-dicarboxylate ABC transporter permease [Gammaproteobacteria bacterium]|nr:MAG: C4-dicarboxylate ABC transporter permease [Gammaproteobacteria bacterium]
MRSFSNKYLHIFLSCWLIMGVCFHLYTAAYGVFEAWMQRILHLSWVFPLSFIYWPFSKNAPKDRVPWYDWCIALLSIAPGVYGIIYAEEILFRVYQVDLVTDTQLVLGVVLVLCLLEATRRLLGLPLTLISSFFAIYMVFGSYFPGVMQGEEFTLREVIESLFLTTDGIFSMPLGVSATYVVIFLIFGSFLEVSGVGPWFMEFSSRIAGKSVGGPAKIAVVSSCLFGSISGSAVANVYSTGNFTIPMMKRTGFAPHLAGGIETMASTGGQIMPPLMGAGAFVMSAYLGVEFKVVMVAALLPALLYYGTALIMIHYMAKRDGFKGLSEAELPHWSDVLKRSFLLLPILVLTVALLMGKTPMLAGLIGIILSWGVSLFNRGYRMTPRRLIAALIAGGKAVPVIAIACASAGIVIGSIALTGIGFKIGALIATLSGNSSFITLVLIALLAVIFGMGLPTTSAYIITAALGVSSLTAQGIEPLNAHLFVFYFAVLSNMTPPVALAAFAAGTVAKDNPMKIALTAMRIGVIAFIVPFAFAYDATLLLQGHWLDIGKTMVVVAFAGYLLSIGFSGFLQKKLSIWLRLLFIVSGLICFSLNWLLLLIGIGSGMILLYVTGVMPKSGDVKGLTS